MSVLEHCLLWHIFKIGVVQKHLLNRGVGGGGTLCPLHPAPHYTPLRDTNLSLWIAVQTSFVLFLEALHDPGIVDVVLPELSKIYYVNINELSLVGHLTNYLSSVHAVKLFAAFNYWAPCTRLPMLSVQLVAVPNNHANVSDILTGTPYFLL